MRRAPGADSAIVDAAEELGMEDAVESENETAAADPGISGARARVRRGDPEVTAKQVLVSSA